MSHIPVTADTVDKSCNSFPTLQSEQNRQDSRSLFNLQRIHTQPLTLARLFLPWVPGPVAGHFVNTKNLKKVTFPWQVWLDLRGHQKGVLCYKQGTEASIHFKCPLYSQLPTSPSPSSFSTRQHLLPTSISWASSLNAQCDPN